MKLYVVRHGETEWNTRKRLQGRTDVPLNEFGKTIAIKTGLGLQGIVFDQVISSPLSRAKDTAQLIITHSGNEQPIFIDDRIQEIGFGIYEGLSCKAEARKIPDDNFRKFFKDSGAYRAPEGAESLEEVMARVQEFLDELCQRAGEADQNILIVAHGTSIRGLINCITGNTIAEYWKGGVHHNCGVTLIEYDGTQLQIVEENRVYYDDVVAKWE